MEELGKYKEGAVEEEEEELEWTRDIVEQPNKSFFFWTWHFLLVSFKMSSKVKFSFTKQSKAKQSKTPRKSVYFGCFSYHLFLIGQIDPFLSYKMSYLSYNLNYTLSTIIFWDNSKFSFNWQGLRSHKAHTYNSVNWWCFQRWNLLLVYIIAMPHISMLYFLIFKLFVPKF